MEEYKLPTIAPFAFVESITNSKENLIVDDWSEKQYNPFIINKALSFGADTVIYANEMNSRPHLDKKLQHDFLKYIIKPKKRYNKWFKADKLEAIEIIKSFYGYSTQQAHRVHTLFSQEQLDLIKQKLQKGGLSK
jgi:hypothetical protein